MAIPKIDHYQVSQRCEKKRLFSSFMDFHSSFFRNGIHFSPENAFHGVSPSGTQFV